MDWHVRGGRDEPLQSGAQGEAAGGQAARQLLQAQGGQRHQVPSTCLFLLEDLKVAEAEEKKIVVWAIWGGRGVEEMITNKNYFFLLISNVLIVNVLFLIFNLIFILFNFVLFFYFVLFLFY